MTVIYNNFQCQLYIFWHIEYINMPIIMNIISVITIKQELLITIILQLQYM